MADDGSITGTPTEEGDFEADVQVQDADSPAQTNSKTLPISVKAEPDCASKGDLYDIKDPNIISLAPQQIYDMLPQGGSGLGNSFANQVTLKVRATAIAKKTADGKFKDEPMGAEVNEMTGVLTAWLADAKDNPTLGPYVQKVRIRDAWAHEYRLSWKGAIYPNDGNGLTGKWNREVTYELDADDTAITTDFSSTEQQ